MIIEYGILQLIILGALYYYLGLMKMLLFLIIFFQLLSLVIDYFGFQFAVGQDIIHFFDSEKVIPNCVGYIEMEKKKSACFREYLLNKGVMKVRKLHQIPRMIFGFFFWQDVTSEKAIQQFSYVDDKFNQESDVIKY